MEVVSLYLDPGNTHYQDRLDDPLSSVLSKYPDQLREERLVIRLDSGYGADKNIRKLSNIKRLKFLDKGYFNKQAAKIAESVPLKLYTKADESAWIYELLPLENGVRRILVQILSSKGDLTYTILYTSISKKKLSSVEIFHFCNDRHTIEDFFKMAKITYKIKNLRTCKFYGIYTFLWMVFITHNLIA